MTLAPVPGGPAGYPFPEKKARHHLGVTEDEMRALRNRHLIETLHFARGKQQAVWLNQDAVAVLEAMTAPPETGDKQTPSTPRTAEPDPVKKAPAEIILLVVNCTLKHRYLLLACAPGEDPDRPQKTVRVRVNATGNFVRRMEIPVRLVEGYDDLYDLTRRCPRQKGKW